MREQLLAVEKVQAIEWRDGALYLLDQRLLPHRQTWLRFDSATEVADGIRDMVVRGAPAIGIAAAYGLVLGVRARLLAGGDWREELEADFACLERSRPTAVNLFWALQRMRERLARLKDGDAILALLEAEAVGIHLSDREANLTMAQLGMELIRKHQGNEQGALFSPNLAGKFRGFSLFRSRNGFALVSGEDQSGPDGTGGNNQCHHQIVELDTDVVGD